MTVHSKARAYGADVLGRGNPQDHKGKCDRAEIPPTRIMAVCPARWPIGAPLIPGVLTNREALGQTNLAALRRGVAVADVAFGERGLRSGKVLAEGIFLYRLGNTRAALSVVERHTECGRHPCQVGAIAFAG